MLDLCDITYVYPDAEHAVISHVSLSVSPGERVALVAPSGFGKTTLCKIVAGYVQPTQGRVLVDGKPLNKRGARQVQMIFQHPELAVDPRMRLRKTFAEATKDTAEIERLCEELGIKQAWLSRFPHELSGGELQRICIARALAVHPRYLVADEISTMLDAITQADLWQFLMRETAAQNAGMLFVTHSPALTKRIATRVVDLQKLTNTCSK